MVRCVLTYGHHWAVAAAPSSCLAQVVVGSRVSRIAPGGGPRDRLRSQASQVPRANRVGLLRELGPIHVAAVLVAALRRSELEAVVAVAPESDLVGVEFARADLEGGRPLLRGKQ